MKILLTALLSLSLIGCSTLRDILPSSWDANEAAAITDIRMMINNIDCASAETALVTTTKIEERTEWLWTYADTRQSKDVLRLIRPFNETAEGLHDRAKGGEMSRGFCLAKVTIMSKQADAIASALQSRNK
jgi:hypothetical protein